MFCFLIQPTIGLALRNYSLDILSLFCHGLKTISSHIATYDIRAMAENNSNTIDSLTDTSRAKFGSALLLEREGFPKNSFVRGIAIGN